MALTPKEHMSGTGLLASRRAQVFSYLNTDQAYDDPRLLQWAIDSATRFSRIFDSGQRLNPASSVLRIIEIVWYKELLVRASLVAGKAHRGDGEP